MAQAAHALRPEVAVRYALSDSGHTRMYVPRLDREVDLTQLTLAEADELVALPGGFEWLVPVVPATEAGGPAAAAEAAAPKGKRKSGA
ncbi:hypothetical protein [Hymenobacter terricola]|uniref:hypothetical protein n=1 Tax=Hymenobacter terricola TaxID=2819236 RepID=UPI001B30517F|nr:hypothetical protein [Hymenobacter terricola]